MPAVNMFEGLLEQRMAELIQAYVDSLGANCLVVPGESKEIDTNPRIVVSATSAEEAVYQSAIYEVTLEISAKVNLDAEGSDDPANVNSCHALFGAILDVIQMPDLIRQLNDTNKIFVHGVVPGSQRLNEIVERQWDKVLSVQIFGFAVPQS